MTESRFVLDTNAAIYVLKNDTVPESFADADFAISVITRLELLAKRDITEEDEAALRGFMANIAVTPITEAVEAAVIALRRSTKVKLPDCIVAATAIALNATLLTHDDKLLHLAWPGYRVRDIPENL